MTLLKSENLVPNPEFIEITPGIFSFKELSDRGLINGFSGKSLGNMSLTHAGEYGQTDENVLKLRQSFAASLGANLARVARLELIHGDNIGIATLDNVTKEHPRTDGLITNVRGIGLLVLTGDCAPVIYFDTKTHAIGLAHVGRLGAHLGIHQKVITEMSDKFGSQASDIIVAIGPTICGNCYVFNNEEITLDREKWGSSLRYTGNRVGIDIAGHITSDLEHMGARVLNSGLCTMESDKFFSHHGKVKSTPDGRFITLIQFK